MWIKCQDNQLVETEALLGFDIVKEKIFDEDWVFTGKYILRAIGRHRSKWGNMKVDMFTGSLAECQERLERLEVGLEVEIDLT